MKRLWMLIPAFALAITGCKKDDPVTPTPTPQTHTYTLNEVLQAYEPTMQTFTLDATNGGTITGAKGGTFAFQANSFVNSAGQPVTGNVTIHLKEVYSPMDMMLSGVYPRSASGPLYTGGEFYIDATQGSQQLSLANGMQYGALIPADNVTGGMFVFNGNTVNSEVVWNMNPDSSFNNISPLLNQYGVQCDSMDWVNCDQFTGASQQSFTSLNVYATSPVTLQAAKAFIYYDGHNSIFNFIGDPLSAGASTNECWIGQQVHIVVVGYDSSGNLYSSVTAVTVTANGSITTAVSAVSASGLAAQMNNLP